MRSISLKSKVALGIAILTVGIVMLVSAAQMHFMRVGMVRMLSDQQFAAVTRVAHDIDGKFESDRDILVRLAGGFRWPDCGPARPRPTCWIGPACWAPSMNCRSWGLAAMSSPNFRKSEAPRAPPRRTLPR